MSERERKTTMRKSSLGERSRADPPRGKKKIGVETESAHRDRGKIESLIEGISDLSPAEERESVASSSCMTFQ